MRADGGEEDPDALLVPLEPDGQTLEDGVHAQRQDEEKVPEISEHHKVSHIQLALEFLHDNVMLKYFPDRRKTNPVLKVDLAMCREDTGLGGRILQRLNSEM